MRKLLLSLFALAALTTAAFAQNVPVQQAATRLDAATVVGYAAAAVGSQTIDTIVVPGGNFAYIVGISADICADGTGGTALANSAFTTTNLQSTPSLYTSFTGTANTCSTGIRQFYATPLKSSNAGTNVVVTSPGASAHNQFAIRVYYYLAP